MKTNIQTKLDMIEALYQKGEYIHKVNDVEYRTRCPFCGDSQKNLRTGHLYIRIGLNDNFPMVYNCFRCNEQGIVNKEFINAMEIDNLSLSSALITLNKTSDKLSSYKFVYGEKEISFNFERPEIVRSRKTRYIEDRLGLTLSNDDLKKLKIITSLNDFLILNEIEKLMCPKEWAQKIEKNYIGFLSYGATHILFRDVTETEYYRWLKYPITPQSKEARIFYSMETELNIFTEDIITINLAEGVLDIASACFNLGYNNPNTLNISVGGKQYYSVIKRLINMGLVGDNIIVNIFADNDEKFNKKNDKPTDLNYFKKVFKKMKYLFKEVNVYYNILSKDIGVPKNAISLKKDKL